VNVVYTLYFNEFVLIISSFYLPHLRQVLEMICSVRCYVIWLEKCTYSLIIEFVKKKVSDCVLHIDGNL